MSLAGTRKQWVVLCNSEIFGLVSAHEIIQGMTEGKIRDDDCVWKKGWTQWRLIKTIPIFSDICERSPGSGREVPDVPVPGSEEFQQIVTPQISPDQCRLPVQYDGLCTWIVLGATVIGGSPGAAVANVIVKLGKIKTDILHDPEVLAAVVGKLAG